MNEEIVQWAVVKRDVVEYCFHEENSAKECAKRNGGTVVKLTGEMPRKPIERKTVAWVEFREPIEHSEHSFERLGIWDIAKGKFANCQTKVEICVRELSDE